MDGLKDLNMGEQRLADPPKKAGALVAAWRFLKGLHMGKGLLGRIAFGCFCSVLVGVVTNLPYLRMAILWICQAVLFIFGKPELPASLKDRVETVIAKGRESSGDEGRLRVLLEKLKDKAEDKPVQHIKEEVKEKLSSSAVAPVKEKIAEAKEKVTEAKEEVKEKVTKAKDTVKEGLEKLGNRLADRRPGETDEERAERRATAAQEAAERKLAYMEARQKAVEAQQKAVAKQRKARAKAIWRAQRDAAFNDMSRMVYGAAAQGAAQDAAAQARMSRMIMGGR